MNKLPEHITARALWFKDIMVEDLRSRGWKVPEWLEKMGVVGEDVSAQKEQESR